MLNRAFVNNIEVEAAVDLITGDAKQEPIEALKKLA